MKKITLICFLFLVASAINIQAQDFTREERTYRMRVRGSNPELYVTIPTSNPIPDGERLNLTFEELDVTSNRQILFISANPDGRFAMDDEGVEQPLDFIIESLIEGQGALVFAEPDTDEGPGNSSSAIAIQSEPGGDILETSPEAGQWFFRGDNLWFNGVRIDVDNAGAARRVAATSGEITLSGGGGTVFDFVEADFDPTLSTDVKQLSSNDFFVSNPVNNVLEISSNVLKINQVEVYSLLGNKVLTQSADALSTTNMNVASLSAGVYIVKIDSSKGAFSTKIIKQ